MNTDTEETLRWKLAETGKLVAESEEARKDDQRRHANEKDRADKANMERLRALNTLLEVTRELRHLRGAVQHIGSGLCSTKKGAITRRSAGMALVRLVGKPPKENK
jgi:hypothetical protein